MASLIDGSWLLPGGNELDDLTDVADEYVFYTSSVGGLGVGAHTVQPIVLNSNVHLGGVKPHTSGMHPCPTWTLHCAPTSIVVCLTYEAPSSLCWQDFPLVVSLLLHIRCQDGIGGVPRLPGWGGIY